MNEIVKPKNLKENDLIVVVAPGRSVKPEQLETTLQIIKSWGFRVELGKNIYQTHNLGYAYAGTDEQRLADMQWALNHSEAKAIWFAAGGYGAIKLLDKLDWKGFFARPKWLIGFSDNSVFHNFVNQKGIASLYAPTVKPLSYGHSEKSYSNLLKVLKGGKISYEFTSHKYNLQGNLEGEIIGGNVAMIYSCLGSKSSLETKNKILFLEDWYENWYALDRMLVNFERNGLLENAQGFLIGSFKYMDLEKENTNYQSDFDPMSEEIINTFLVKYNKPTSFGISAGHLHNFMPLPFQSPVSILINDSTSQLEFS